MNALTVPDPLPTSSTRWGLWIRNQKKNHPSLFQIIMTVKVLSLFNKTHYEHDSQGLTIRKADLHCQLISSDILWWDSCLVQMSYDGTVADWSKSGKCNGQRQELLCFQLQHIFSSHLIDFMFSKSFCRASSSRNVSSAASYTRSASAEVTWLRSGVANMVLVLRAVCQLFAY